MNLKQLATATEQQVFDYVVNFLRDQGVQSTIPDVEGAVGCAYRGGINRELKCAAGCLIGDDEYTPEWEGNRWRDLVYITVVPSANLALIEQLQYAHDRAVPDESGNILPKWEESWKRIANLFNLIYTAP